MNIVLISVISLLVNTFLGRYRAKHRKFSWGWFFFIHASIPLIVPLRIWLDVSNLAIPLFIALAVLGQYMGSYGRIPKEKQDSVNP